MFGPIRVAAIDDEPAHLLAITTGLSANGIPCTGYWYDRDTNQLMPEPAAGGLPLLRLIFMDLNLAELGGIPETATLCAGVMNVLKQLVAKDGGPYLLVFWTQVGAKVEDVGTMLRERLEPVEGVPPPIAVVGLDKGPFLVGEPKDKDFNTALKDFYAALHKIVPELAKIVNSVVSHDPQLCALSAWEGRAAEAAGRAVNEVNLCARNDVTDPSNTSTSIQGVLATIAVAASGPRPANAAPARALDAGMVDILVDQFGASVDDPDYQAVVQRAIGEAVKKKVAFRDDVKMFAGLNTFFHIDTEVASAKTWDRGVVIPATPPLDENVLGFSGETLIPTEFLYDETAFPKEQRAEITALWEAFAKSPQVVLVELGADCDHAQDKHRTRRYLVGLEVPVPFFKLARSPKDGTLRNGSLQLLGPWNINNESTYLLVSCRRFWAWQGKEPPPATQVKYRLRATIVNKLLHHYSVWSSRPGIVEFRPTH